ncbi:methylmalonyl Co-A mutase-associated GTPase MeaB [Janibacter sp. GS2]|uniref:methylmalonyl Co-A mutase-associated GTPase MeaB n=1 Tax=Janibacter sp. GS2 TaxID=3442646 RepID=UPI003EB72512
MIRTIDVPALVEQTRAGTPRAIGRLISLVEDQHPALREAMAALAPYTGGAHVIGLTGAPGVGKSTTTNALIRALREAGKRVAVLAVDPSSPFSGGALLGDRIRMTEASTDPGVYIRSLASRGHLGGLSVSTPQAIRVLDAAGFDAILVETVGVGQSEVAVAGSADTTLVLLAPGMGDGIQAAKAGILEIGDVFVVNKADREGADATVRDLRHMIQMGEGTTARGWRRPVVRASAMNGAGIDDIDAAIGEHLSWLASSGELRRRRTARTREEISALAVAELRARMGDLGSGGLLDQLATHVVDGASDPFAAADELLASIAPG